MPAPSLYELARQRLIRNIDMLNDIGDLPFSFLEPVLRFIQSPAQLQELENNCPQLVGETGDIWLRFIKRDVPDWETKPHEPRDPKNWGKVYRKLIKDVEKEKEADAEALKQHMRAIQNDRAQNKTLIMGGIVAAPRRGTIPTGGRTHGWGIPGAPVKTGKAALDKLRRGMFDQSRERVPQIPAHILAQRKPQVRQAPARMVRMAENEAPKTMLLSRKSSASVARPPPPRPTTSRPQITQRPMPQPQQPPPPNRASLPAGRQFHAPKATPAPEASASPAPKRRREEYSVFHQPKRKRMI